MRLVGFVFVCISARGLSGLYELGRTELMRTKLALAELARTELIRTKLALAELARTELARMELA